MEIRQMQYFDPLATGIRHAHMRRLWLGKQICRIQWTSLRHLTERLLFEGTTDVITIKALDVRISQHLRPSSSSSRYTVEILAVLRRFEMKLLAQ